MQEDEIDVEAELGALMPRRAPKRKMQMHADDEERRVKRLVAAQTRYWNFISNID